MSYLKKRKYHNDKIEEGEKMLPEIIYFYNSTNGGLDTLDQLSANYSVSRKS